MTAKVRSYVKKLVAAAVILALAAAVFAAGVNIGVILSTRGKIMTRDGASDVGADCILVLGAGVWGDSPSHMLADRLDEGIALYELGAAPKILMSGDHGRTEYDEVNVMKDYAVERGADSTDVFMDHAGFSTYESLYRARDVFCTEKIVIVTQRYHLYRALYIADRLGLEAVGVVSEPRTYAGQAVRDVREALARVKDFGMCIFMPEPTYLGEAIPISGSGDLTNDREV